MPEARIQAIYRYPVKGLSPQALGRVALERRPDPAGRPPLCHRERPLRLRSGRTRLFPQAALPDADAQRAAGRAAHRLRRGKPYPDHPLGGARGGARRLADQGRPAGGRSLLPPLHAGRIARSRPRCCSARATASRTSPRRWCRSSISPRSRRWRMRQARPVNPLRFRANVYVEGWPAWREFDLLDREISLGSARLKVVKRIVRCAATEVDPDTGMRDLPIPQTLMQTFGHADCGVYAEVIAAARSRSAIAWRQIKSARRRGREYFRQHVVGVARLLLHALLTLRRCLHRTRRRLRAAFDHVHQIGQERVDIVSGALLRDAVRRCALRPCGRTSGLDRRGFVRLRSPPAIR